jgi:hypothetical protein
MGGAPMILTPGSKTRLLTMLAELTKLVENDHNRDFIQYRSTELAHYAVGLLNYYTPEVPKKKKKDTRTSSMKREDKMRR